MKNIVWLFLLAVLFFSGCMSKKINAILTNEVFYSDENNKKATILYYSLSDYSLHFVKFIMDKELKITLPQIISSSGVRYSDNYLYTLWVQGGTATLEKKTENKEWKIIAVFTQIEIEE